GMPVASTITSMRGSPIIAIVSSVIKVARLPYAPASEDAAYCAAGQPAVANWLFARAVSRSATATTCRPRVRRACDRNMVPNLPAPIRPTVTGRPAASRSRSLADRFTGVVSRNPYRWRRKHGSGVGTSRRRAFGSLAERTGDEGFGLALGSVRAAGQINLGRTGLGRGHVDALAGLEALRLADGIGGGDAIGRAVGRDLADLVTADDAGWRVFAGDAFGGVVGRVRRVGGSDAGLVSEILDALADVAVHGLGAIDLPVEPFAGRLEEPRLVLLGFRWLLSFRRGALRHCRQRQQRQKAGADERRQAMMSTGNSQPHGRQAGVYASAPTIHGIRAGGYRLRTTDGEIEEPRFVRSSIEQR